jgi:hypothetical protein
MGSLYEKTRGKAILSPAICDRCRLRGAGADMVPDGDKPGLFVHRRCADVLDPWKLPPRMTEDVSIPNPRPDARLVNNHPGLLTNQYDPDLLYDNFGNPLTP